MFYGTEKYINRVLYYVLWYRNVFVQSVRVATRLSGAREKQRTVVLFRDINVKIV